MSREMRGRDSARLVKFISFLVILVGLGMACWAFNANDSHPFLVKAGLAVMALGFVGFIVGRFME